MAANPTLARRLELPEGEITGASIFGLLTEDDQNRMRGWLEASKSLPLDVALLNFTSRLHDVHTLRCHVFRDGDDAGSKAALMNVPEYGSRRDLARRIRAHRSELSEAVTDEFLDRHPDWVARYGDLARRRGVEDAVFHMDFLAGAVESGAPSAFAEYGRWTASMLASRGIAPRYLAENLEQLHRGLEKRLDPTDHEFLGAVVQAGIEGVQSETDQSEGDAARPDARDGQEDADDTLALSRSIYLQSILHGDKRGAVKVVDEALRSHPVTTAHRKIVEEAQIEIGRLWAANEITVAREHMATAVSQFVLGELYSRLPMPDEVVGRAIVTGVEGEQHQLGGNMVADLLEAEGWSVRFLGTQMPHRDIVKAAKEHDAQAVGISATMLFNVTSVSNLIQDLRALERPNLRIVVGGRAFQSSPGLWRDIGADGAGRNLDEALATFRDLNGPAGSG